MSENPTDPLQADLALGEGATTQENDDSSQDHVVADKENSIENVCDDMLKKVLDYFNGELTATCEDYRLLEKLNTMTVAKYQEMSEKANSVTGNMSALNEKYRALQPFLQQIDHLEEGVQKLEAAAYQLDTYSKQLEARFKKLDKR